MGKADRPLRDTAAQARLRPCPICGAQPSVSVQADKYGNYVILCSGQDGHRIKIANPDYTACVTSWNALA